MVNRRYIPNFTLIFLGLICLSIWQIVGGPDLFPIIAQSPSGPLYSLNELNSSSVFSYSVSSLPSSDYQQLINITDFKFMLFSSVCIKSSPTLLVLIHSDPKNFSKRKTIRETWGQHHKNMSIIFLLGKVNDTKLQENLELENNRHRDIAQGSFMDAYRNLTYKHVMAFKYAIYHCPEAKYILKTDDDVFVNTPTLMDFLNTELPPNTNKLLLCQPCYDARVIRSYRSKWRVSFAEYRDKYYPMYCAGWALLYSPDVLFSLYEEVQKTKYFWIDDVHITGTLFKKTNLVHTNVNPLTLEEYEVVKIVSDQHYNISRLFFFGPPNLRQNDIHSLWKYVKNHNKNVYIARYRR